MYTFKRITSMAVLALFWILSTLVVSNLNVSAEKNDTAQNLGGDRIVGFGKPVDDHEIERLSITVFPDGRGLPKGSGNVEKGQALYTEHCASCHGEKGIEGPASRLVGSDGFFSPDDPDRMSRIRKYPILLLSTGAQWPYATSLFDFIRRAMPHVTPKSLTNDEVYAVTAYVLYMNAIVEKDIVLNKENLPEVKMPGLERSVTRWPEER